jgi:MFS family permease
VRRGFAAVLRGREFRLLWLANAQSLLGDQLAPMALSVLVYDRTGSGLVTAAVYALTFLPALFGSVLLGPLADRLPRLALLVGGDVIRAVLLAVMALPPLPVAVLAGLLATSTTGDRFA